MVKYQRTHLPPSEDDNAPRVLTKQEFGRRVYRLMLDRGMRQSDLARAAGILRDSVSTYVRGRALPTPLNLQKISEALGVDPEELLPNHAAIAVEKDDPDFEMRASTADPNKVFLRINRFVSFQTAAKIVNVLNDDSPDPK